VDRPEGAGPFERARAAVAGVDRQAATDALALCDRLTKPRGALGALEGMGARLAAIAGTCPPPVPAPATVAVFAGDHGVLAEGVSPWPAEVTAQMVANLCAGGAAANVLARHVGADVVVVDVGVAAVLDQAPNLLVRKVRPGTANLAHGPAMTREEALRALDVGAEVAAAAVAGGARCLVTGDMGIANTTPSAAIVAAFTGRAPEEVTGRGTGIDDRAWARKAAVVAAAVDRLPAGADPVGVLAAVGGLEIAALAGFVVGGAAAGVPVLVDGVVALAGLLAATALAPGAGAYCFAGHRSPEPGASAALGFLGLDPVLDLGMRLGEGTGASLALPLLQASAKVLREMATFDAAGVTDKAPGA
jgi:nicotinate-nucleotide--dimethylbenzimidazole phosphoribosyltransferase